MRIIVSYPKEHEKWMGAIYNSTELSLRDIEKIISDGGYIEIVQ